MPLLLFLALALYILAVRALVGLDVFELAFLAADGVELRSLRAAVRRSLDHGSLPRRTSDATILAPP